MISVMSKLHRFFVYGTLKRGQPNHYLVTGSQYGSAEFVSEGTTTDKWPLIIYTPYNIPFMLDKPGTGNRIQGELYDIDDAMLKSFDELEQHPDWYKRKKIQVHAAGETIEQSVWCYTLPDFKDELLSLPMISNYDNRDRYCYVPGKDRTDKVDVKALVRKGK